MNKTARCGLWVVILLSMPGRFAAAEDGFVSLFDGKTLDGWNVNCLPKDAQFARTAWTVNNGSLLANTIGHEEHLRSWNMTVRVYWTTNFTSSTTWGPGE